MSAKWKKTAGAVLSAALLLTGCTGNGGYYEEKYDDPLADRDVGGYDVLTLLEEEERLTLENENVRIILDAETGTIVELVNKESKLYLTREGDADPVRINRIKDGREVSDIDYKTFAYSVEEDSAARKALRLSWTFSDVTVSATVSLCEGADEVVFRLSVRGNSLTLQDGIPTGGLYNVEYPIINRIDSLYDKQTDYFLSPFTTGYLFRNPVDNFNGSFPGITKSYGLYPSGWEYPMQFQSYFSEGIGGFQFMTRDGGDTIKSFTFTGQDGRLRASVYHYVDDLAKSDFEFDYDISVSNLTQGLWYESAEKYRDWATEQSWATEKGALSERTDVDKSFFEEVAMTNFCFPYTGSYGTEKQKELYELTKSSLGGGKILNVAFGDKGAYGDNLLPLARENGDYFLFFEFPDFHSVSSANANPTEWETAVRTYLSDTSSVFYNVNGTVYFYECASCEEYTDRFLETERSYYEKYAVDGYYHDVGVAAVHPKQCFDTTHPHGTRVNVIGDYVEQMKEISDLAHSNGGYYGQELIFEQMLPYIDFYQARANAEQLGWMESDRVRTLIEEGSCRKVSLFDYVYGAYGAKRLDGFLTADPIMGGGYYYVAAYTVLNGGIPEYNYEFFEAADLLAPEDYDYSRVEYLGELFRVKNTFGKDYLLYGQAVKPPKTGAGTTVYDYVQTRFGGKDRVEGTAEFDDAVVTAYRYGDKIGVFIANVTSEPLSLKFILNALRDYGMENGTVTLIDGKGTSRLSEIRNGKAAVDLSISAYEVVLLEIG